MKHYYPNTKKITISQLFKNKRLYQGLGLYLGGQIPLLLLAIGVNDEINKYTYSIVALLIALTLTILAIKTIIKTHKPSEQFNIITIIILFIVTLTLTLIVLTTYNAIVETPQQQENQKILIDLLKTYPVTLSFLVILIFPILEEISFRELLPKAFGSSYLGFAIASFIFMLVHMPTGIIGWVSYGILTIVFLYTRLRYDNLYMSIAIHILWNAFSISSLLF